jgi:FkbH-like protein
MTSADGQRDDGIATLNTMLVNRDPAFWSELNRQSVTATAFEDVLFLSTVRKRATAAGLSASRAEESPFRLAVVGAYSLYPLRELIEHLLVVNGIACEIFCGEFDSYHAEILNPKSALYQCEPQAVFLLPSSQRCCYSGSLVDRRDVQRAEVTRQSSEILSLCQTLHEGSRADVIVGNFVPPARHDPGAYRTKSLGSDWSFRRAVNLEIGLSAPSYLHICDLDFLASRLGLLNSHDDRAWFESKQLGAPDFLLDVARELVHVVSSLRASQKKVLVVDLDNTLWGGVVGDDGLEGLELGDTSPRGEAFKAFQRYIVSLSERGVLLAVCSKNDHACAVEPFEKHPEMVVRMEHVAAFRANWNPKPDNLGEIADELNLGLDGLVFVDDDVAEIEIVRQFAPQVSTLLLAPDPADRVAQLQDSRFFEPVSLTPEDRDRAKEYRREGQRKTMLASITDVQAYLASLEMKAMIRPFNSVDVPRIAQLINKTNQFNLTSRRRSEAEVVTVLSDLRYAGFSLRLSDRFGDYGLVSAVICEHSGRELRVDTWLMSCRVLNRQVEEETMNHLMSLAGARGCDMVIGRYVPTARNTMTRDLYPRMGFHIVRAEAGVLEFCRAVNSYDAFQTHIESVGECQAE